MLGRINYGVQSYSTSNGYVSSMTLRNKGTGADTVLNFKRGSDIQILQYGQVNISSGGQTIFSYNATGKNGTIIVSIGVSYNSTIWKVDVDNNRSTKYWEANTSYTGRTSVTCSNKIITGKTVTYGIGSGSYILVGG